MLKITRSDLTDLNTRTFAEMNMNIKNLRLSFNNLRYLKIDIAFKCSSQSLLFNLQRSIKCNLNIMKSEQESLLF